MDNQLQVGMVRLIFAIGVLLLGISSCYYFLYALPKIQNQKADIQNQQTHERVTADRWEREQQCSARAEHFFKESSWSDKDSGWYESHFNHKLNRCFILVKSNMYDAKSVFMYRVLVDVNDGKTIAEYDKQVMHGQADYATKPFMCSMLDKYCTTDEEFDNFVKTYMGDN